MSARGAESSSAATTTATAKIDDASLFLVTQRDHQYFIILFYRSSIPEPAAGRKRFLRYQLPALAITGSDSSGGGGIQADLKTLAAPGSLDLPNLVVDPVMAAESGGKLLADDAVATVRTALLPRVRVVTPNRREAEVLTGRPIASAAEARDAARRIHDMGPAAVIVTGGACPAARSWTFCSTDET